MSNLPKNLQDVSRRINAVFKPLADLWNQGKAALEKGVAEADAFLKQLMEETGRVEARAEAYGLRPKKKR